LHHRRHFTHYILAAFCRHFIKEYDDDDDDDDEDNDDDVRERVIQTVPYLEPCPLLSGRFYEPNRPTVIINSLLLARFNSHICDACRCLSVRHTFVVRLMDIPRKLSKTDPQLGLLQNTV